MTDLAELIAALVKLVQDAVNAGTPQAPVYVVPSVTVNSGTDCLRWLQALGPVIALIGAVLLSNRALKHDRNMRVIDDAREALADALGACDQAVEAIDSAVLGIHARWKTQQIEDRDGEVDSLGELIEPPDDFEQGKAKVEAEDDEFGAALKTAKNQTLRALMFFAPDTEIGHQLSSVIVSVHHGWLGVLDAIAEDERKARKKLANEASGVAAQGVEDLRVVALMFARGDLEIDAEPLPETHHDDEAADEAVFAGSGGLRH